MSLREVYFVAIALTAEDVPDVDARITGEGRPLWGGPIRPRRHATPDIEAQAPIRPFSAGQRLVSFVYVELE